MSEIEPIEKEGKDLLPVAVCAFVYLSVYLCVDVSVSLSGQRTTYQWRDVPKD